MNRPLVSLVTPAYNQAQYLEQTIESVLSQDFHSFEYVVLDDGSTDATRDVLGRYTGRLRWETHANMGQARTLNKGWHMSSGDIVGYLSADDILYPGALTALVQALEERSCAVMVYPNYD